MSKAPPLYQCHKRVHALKIRRIDHLANPDQTGQSVSASYGAFLMPEDTGHQAIQVPGDWVMKHRPQPGGYYVIYEDGHASYSPAKAFEEGYSLVGEDEPVKETPALAGTGRDRATLRDDLLLSTIRVGAEHAVMGATHSGPAALGRALRLFIEAAMAEPTPAPAMLALPVIDTMAQSTARAGFDPVDSAETRSYAGRGGLVAVGPSHKVTPDDVAGEIRAEYYFTAAHGVLGQSEMGTAPASWAGLDRLTICVLVLANGSKVVGLNYGAIDPANHSAETGKEEARAMAIEKVWELLGFRLRDIIANTQPSSADGT